LGHWFLHAEHIFSLRDGDRKSKKLSQISAMINRLIFDHEARVFAVNSFLPTPMIYFKKHYENKKDLQNELWTYMEDNYERRDNIKDKRIITAIDRNIKLRIECYNIHEQYHINPALEGFPNRKVEKAEQIKFLSEFYVVLYPSVATNPSGVIVECNSKFIDLFKIDPRGCNFKEDLLDKFCWDNYEQMRAHRIEDNTGRWAFMFDEDKTKEKAEVVWAIAWPASPSAFGDLANDKNGSFCLIIPRSRLAKVKKPV
jgi:hypothetical protein